MGQREGRISVGITFSVHVIRNGNTITDSVKAEVCQPF